MQEIFLKFMYLMDFSGLMKNIYSPDQLPYTTISLYSVINVVYYDVIL